MSVEIERKFVPVGPPALEGLGGTLLRQGYVAEDGDVSVRVRVADSAATLTVKGGHGLTRVEVECEISLEQADVLWPHTAGRRLEKVRTRVPLDGGVTAEVDRYLGDLEGLCTVEVEFVDQAAAEAFVPPVWFGREVTGQVEWTNASLSRHGPPA